MGVNIAHYVVAGMSIPYEDYDYEEYEKELLDYWKKPQGRKLGMLYDGMSGDYIIAGLCLAATDYNHEYFADGPVDCTISNDEILEIKRYLHETFKIDNPTVKIFAVTHHT